MKLKISLLVIFSIFIIIGISIKINNYYKKYQINKIELNNINNYIKKNNNTYISILEIPSINLKKGLNYNNNVEQGIAILDYHKYDLGNIILASHSGNCNVCYFSNLDKLKINDYIYLYKDNIKYIYKINSIKELKKNTFKLEDTINSITLITCKKSDNNYQIIIKGTLISKNKKV